MGGRHGARAAFPALLGALSLAVLYGAALVPSGKAGLAAVAGLGPCAATASIGMAAGFLCWGGVSLLALLLLPDKLCALLFAAFFGLYPMVKALAERLKKVGEWLVKLAFFDAVFLSLALFTDLLAAESGQPMPVSWVLAAICAAASGIFWIYDVGLTRLICLYLARVDKAVRRFVRR